MAGFQKIKFYLGIACLCLGASACASVPVNQRELLADRIMIFDYDAPANEMRGHMITPREGSIGGFNQVSAGGCSCK